MLRKVLARQMMSLTKMEDISIKRLKKWTVLRTIMASKWNERATGIHACLENRMNL